MQTRHKKPIFLRKLPNNSKKGIGLQSPFSILLLTFCKKSVLYFYTTKYPLKPFGYETRTEGGGLSGEHIQLCAEGARRVFCRISQAKGRRISRTMRALFAVLRGLHFYFVIILRRYRVC